MSPNSAGPLQPTAWIAPTRRTQVAALAFAFAALALALFASRALDAPAVDRAERVEPIFFPRVEILRPALLGFTSLAADLTWIRTVQYFGTRLEIKERFPQLYQLVDMTTSLDPHFLDAYLYGGLFLVIAKQYPNAIAIYEKGIAANPNAWQLPHDLGRLYYLELRDYKQATRWWEITDRLSGRPEYIPRFLIRLQARSGHLETALMLWQQMLEHSANEAVREIARREIQKLLEEMQKKPPADGTRQRSGQSDRHGSDLIIMTRRHPDPSADTMP
jgi:tetratricopeptide (TPR) repeat protein